MASMQYMPDWQRLKRKIEMQAQHIENLETNASANDSLVTGIVQLLVDSVGEDIVRATVDGCCNRYDSSRISIEWDGGWWTRDGEEKVYPIGEHIYNCSIGVAGCALTKGDAIYKHNDDKIYPYCPEPVEPHPLDPPHTVCSNCGLPKLAPFPGLCLNCSSPVNP